MWSARVGPDGPRRPVRRAAIHSPGRRYSPPFFPHEFRSLELSSVNWNDQIQPPLYAPLDRGLELRDLMRPLFAPWFDPAGGDSESARLPAGITGRTEANEGAT